MTQVESARVHLMGTVIDVQVETDSTRPLLLAAVARLRELEHRFSANSTDSELAALNRAAGREAVVVHPELFDLIALGVEHSLAPGSMLNIAIGPLVQTWRIGFADARVPSASEVAAALALTDPREIDLESSTHAVRLGRRGMAIDLGALAKGWAADLLLAELADAGARSVLLNLGGNVVAHGRCPTRDDGLWRIGLRDPREPSRLLETLRVAGGSVVTSGVYQRRLEVGGRTYHHLLDPQTGYPIETDVASLTVLSSRSVDGEIWGSRLFGRPVERILGEVAEQPRLSAVVVTRDGMIYETGEISDPSLPRSPTGS